MAKIRITRTDKRRQEGRRLRVIIYCRVSTDDQEDNGTSLETQEEDCRAYAEHMGLEVVGDAVKETYSGFYLAERKKFAAIRERCRTGEVDGILVRNYDRLSRNANHFSVVLYEAENTGYEIWCVKEQFDNSAFGQASRALMASFAEFEREKIKDRTQAGRLKRVQKGHLLKARPKYGYAFEDEKHTCYVICEEEAKIVRRIYTMYLDGCTLRSIAMRLTEEGIPSANKVGHWGIQTIRNILNDAEYHGVGFAYKWNTIIDERGKRKDVLKPEEERIAIPVGVIPPIVSKELYEQVQARKALAIVENKRNNRHSEDALLRSGFVKCGHCGHAMYSLWTRDRVVYRCGYGTRAIIYGGERHTVQINASTIEPTVWDYACEILQKYEVVERALRDYIGTHQAEADLQAFDGTIKMLEEQQAEIVADLRRTRGHGRDLLLDDLNTLEERLEKVRQEREKIHAGSYRWEAVKQDIEEFLAWASSARVNLATASYEEKRRALRALGIVVQVYSQGDRKKQPHYTIKVTVPEIMNKISCSPVR